MSTCNCSQCNGDVDERIELHYKMIDEAKEYFKNEWPDQLTGGVMFFKGEKITKEEFCTPTTTKLNGESND